LGSVTVIPACANLLAVEIAAICDGIELLRSENGLRLLRHGGELRAIRADIGDLVRDDQMVLGLDRDLHVVADDAGASAARRHRARVGIGERDLLIGALEHPRLDVGEAAHLVPELRDLLPQPGGLGRERL
jgi:hypothetical protein